jgi:hypothetical protein
MSSFLPRRHPDARRRLIGSTLLGVLVYIQRYRAQRAVVPMNPAARLGNKKFILASTPRHLLREE